MQLSSHLQFFEAVNAADDLLNGLRRPDESYEEFVERIPRRRTPQAQDIFDRWELYSWRCTSSDTATESGQPIVEHTKDAERGSGVAGGKCAGCGKALVYGGPRQLGERRAYLGWLTGIMEPEESNLFWMTVVANHADNLLMLGAVPVVRQLLREIGALKQRMDQLELAVVNTATVAGQAGRQHA